MLLRSWGPSLVAVRPSKPRGGRECHRTTKKEDY